MGLFIKNMDCPHCIIAARTIFVSVGIVSSAIHLGEVEINGGMDDEESGQRQRVSAQCLCLAAMSTAR